MNTITPLPALMVQGTTSDAGKSLLVTGLCRVLARRGIAVAPFKPQNMALNSAVTPACDGFPCGEIGRAQALQATAAGLPPHVDMNPVLLKPSSDCHAQVIIHGQVECALDAGAFHDYKSIAMDAVMTSWRRLRARYQVVLVEGAGSPAEINLRDRDIANMGFAEVADCPVVIVADIDRGGVFAHLVGTLQLLSPSEQQRVVGFIINRFRGDIALLEPGLDWLEAHTGKPVLGVLPYLHGLQLDAEDALRNRDQDSESATFRVIAPVLPRISNHTDFDPLIAHQQLDFRFVGPGEPIPAADLIILPGSKNVRADLEFVRAQGWDQALNKHLRYGGKVLGICGGYQMLGEQLHDPLGVEGEAGSSPGLGLLPITTEFTETKQLRQVSGTLYNGERVQGYEIHCGTSRGASHSTATATPLMTLDGPRARAAEGAISADGLVAGTYLHGLFDRPEACTSLLAWAGLMDSQAIDRDAMRERDIERLADCFEENLDLKQLLGVGQ